MTTKDFLRAALQRLKTESTLAGKRAWTWHLTLPNGKVLKVARMPHFPTAKVFTLRYHDVQSERVEQYELSHCREDLLQLAQEIRVIHLVDLVLR